eukprot:708234-Prorocentrum_minimum.AAC.1
MRAPTGGGVVRCGVEECHDGAVCKPEGFSAAQHIEHVLPQAKFSAVHEEWGYLEGGQRGVRGDLTVKCREPRREPHNPT